MKNNAVCLVLLFGSLLLFTIGSCSNGQDRSSDNGLAMDSASVAKRAKDELTLSTLKDKKLAAEQKVREAISNTKEAKRVERDATDAAQQADEAFTGEQAAQKSRQQADEQAIKSDKAANKADKN
jgi:hypothetical protein